MAGKTKSYIILLKVFVSLFLIVLLLYKSDVVLLKDTISRANIFFVLSAFFLYLLAQAISTYRWSKLLFPDKFKLSYRKLLSLYFVGMFFNNFMPTTVGGDLMRCYYLFKNSGRGGASVASVFLERYLGLTAMVFLLLISVIIGYPLLKDTPVILWVSLLFVGSFLLVSTIIWNKSLHRRFVYLLRRLSLYRLIDKIESFTNALMEYRNYPEIIGKVFLLSVIVQVISILIFFQIAQGLALGLPLILFFIFVPLAMVVSMVPLSLAGLGMREGAFVYLFAIIGEPSAKALSLSILWFSMVVFISMWGGVEYIRMGRVRYGEVDALEKLKIEN